MTLLNTKFSEIDELQNWFGFEVANNLFPFFFMFDRNLRVYQSGESLKKIEPKLNRGALLNDFFIIKNPRISLDYQQIVSRSSSQHTWLLNETISMRGQIEPIAEGKYLLFIGSPWITSVEQLSELGLRASDFAKHDATLEHLFIQQAQIAHAEDSERMVWTLTKSAEAYKRLEKLQSELAFELNIASDLKVRFSSKGALVDIQSTVALPYRFDLSECIGKDIHETLPFLAAPLAESISRVRSSEKPVALTFEIDHTDGTHYFDARLTLDPDGFYLLLASDVTQEHLLKLQLEKRANYDMITGLSNRAHFFDRVRERVSQVSDSPTTSALLVVDLDNFKAINDSYGHAAGDFFLANVAKILAKNVRKKDIIARLGGDEFGIYTNELQDDEQILKIAERLCNAISQPVQFKDYELHTGCSIGLAFSHNPSISIDLFQQKADLAMYHAKSKGKGRVVVYQHGMYEEHRTRLQLGEALETAITHNHLTLAYQPVVYNTTGELKGFEALARWEHPKMGNIPPDKFIAIAEESGLMVPLGRCLMKKALQAWSTFKQLNPHAKDWTLALNISAHQMYDKSLENDLKDNILINHLKTSDVVLEITETALIRDIDETIKLITRLKALGFAIALDDFGTGFSSLSYLDQLPLDIIKIDRSFIAKISDENSESPLVESIIRLADVMKLDIVAEGIETKLQQSVLETLGCKFAQGYYFSKPIPESRLFEEMQTRSEI